MDWKNLSICETKWPWFTHNFVVLSERWLWTGVCLNSWSFNQMSYTNITAVCTLLLLLKSFFPLLPHYQSQQKQCASFCTWMLRNMIEALFTGDLIGNKTENKHVSNGWTIFRTQVGSTFPQKATLTSEDWKATNWTETWTWCATPIYWAQQQVICKHSDMTVHFFTTTSSSHLLNFFILLNVLWLFFQAVSLLFSFFF